MNWQAEYDVVVVGSGAGGIVSAITAAEELFPKLFSVVD